MNSREFRPVGGIGCWRAYHVASANDSSVSGFVAHYEGCGSFGEGWEVGAIADDGAGALFNCFLYVRKVTELG